MGLVATAKSAPEITQELATLTKALAEATNMIKLQVGGKLSYLSDQELTIKNIYSNLFYPAFY